MSDQHHVGGRHHNEEITDCPGIHVNTVAEIGRKIVTHICRETVREVLKKKALPP